LHYDCPVISPRVRGTGRGRHGRGGGDRFIPACAGNGSRRGGHPGMLPVHPRVCGERFERGGFVDGGVGSSPRVRGTGRLVGCIEIPGRFIPACAGNGPARTTRRRRRPVHPRVCGERFLESRLSATCAGSSPRVRGTGAGPVPRGEGARFIPACAGNGTPVLWKQTRDTVHPRVCGERRLRRVSTVPVSGSSPRVRGTAIVAHGGPRHWRFIPACAGNGAGAGLPEDWGPVHPRVCGERLNKVKGLQDCNGSSPRVRGTVVVCFLDAHTSRFIPACAGNGSSSQASA